MKRIIVLDKADAWVEQKSFKYCFWADVPVARQSKYAKGVSWVSAYTDASIAELAALRAGQITEKVDTLNFAIGEGLPSIKSTLINRFNDFQSQINSDQTWQFYGTFFDGTTWTAGGL